jgi:hypothetical protein
MNLFKIFSISLLVIGSLLLSTPVKGEESSSPKSIVIADVNIYDAKITSQKGNQINLSFELSNGEGVQAGVRYGVSLLKDTPDGQFLADEFIYPEVLSLSANSSLLREISYLAPVSLSGEYSLMIEAKKESGLPLGIAIPGKVNLTATANMVQISPESCYLSVVDEKDSPKYNLTQGVDIEKTENIKLTCTVSNTSDKVMSVSPSYETHIRTVYGQLVTQEGGDIGEISFNAGEKKTISLVLPKATKAQAYDIKIALKSGNIYSNYITAHYVLRGISATIQNFSLDKDSYNKNDVATLSFVWSPSADGFFGSRFGPSTQSVVTLLAKMTDNKNKGKSTSV